MSNQNAKFATYLKHLQQVKKLNNVGCVNDFINTHYVTGETSNFTVENPTEEMITFAELFIRRKVKCGDTNLSSQFVNWTTSNNAVKEPVVDVVQRTPYRGEY